MNLQTKVIIPKEIFEISHQSEILLIGSCFSENIGSKLKNNKFLVNANPFGILYNPLSIFNVVKRLLDNETFREKDFIYFNNRYHSLMHHGSFSNTQLEEAIKHVNDEFSLASNQLEKANVLLITFGTSYVFRWNDSGEIVGNCHKIPADRFTRERLSVESIFSTWSNLIKRIITSIPDIKIVFTVSPIRHFKDGAHNNQLSKAILHLAIDNLMNAFPETAYYFPAYEIVMDQLRDYRFYTEDMLHPTTLAQNYIWKRFNDTYFSSETKEVNAEWQKISQSISHQPLDSNSHEYQQFLNRTINNLKAFEDKYTYISCFEEKQHLTQLLNSFK